MDEDFQRGAQYNQMTISKTKPDKNNRWITYLVLPQVIMSGWAFGQVEIPQLLYTLYGYISSLFYLAILFKSNFKIQFKYLLSIPIVYFFVNFLWSLSIGELSLDVLTTLLIAEFLILDRIQKVWIFNKFRIFLIIMSICGILCFLSFTLNLGLPYEIIDYYSTTQENSFYLNFHISYIYLDGEHMLYRLCGLYNEPGYLGTITSLCLIIEQVNLKKIGNIIIFIAGALTLSLAFWILIALFFCINHLRNLKFVLEIGGVVVILLLGLQEYQTDNVLIQSLVSRIEFKDGKFKGDNRTNDKFDDLYAKFLSSDKIWVGEGINATERHQITDTSSYKLYIFRFGILGFILLWTTPLLSSLQYSGFNYKCLVIIICFFISTYQRPNFYNSVYMLLLFGGLDYIKLNYIRSKNILIQTYTIK